MTGGKARPKKDKALKVSAGMNVKTGQILVRNMPTYKSGTNTRGQATIFALCPGKVYFNRRKTSHGAFRTFINIQPLEKAG